MKKQEKKIGRIRKAKNRREAKLIDKSSGKASELLESFLWPKESETFLRILAEGVLPFSQVKQLSWSSVNLEKNILTEDGREFYLSDETGNAISEFLEEQSAGSGVAPEEIRKQDGFLFSAETARELQKALSQS